MDAWTFEGQPGALGDTTVTLVEGGSFCVSARNGDIVQGGAQGVYHADTRLLSRWELRVDDCPIEALRVLAGEPYHATFLGRACPRPGRVESTLLVIRDRYVGGGLREDLTLRNLADEPAGCVVDIQVASDVAGLFEVKSGRVQHVADVEVTTDRSGLLIVSATRRRGTRIVAEPAPFAVPGKLIFRVVVPARGEWTVSLQVNPILEGEESPAWFSTHHPLEYAEPARRRADWDRLSSTITTSNRAFSQVLHRSREDLGALRMFDPSVPDEPPTIAAGAPWFMTLFGRDSLLTSWMALPLDQSLAIGTLRRLARLQGTVDDPLTEEKPGKILHELRFGPQCADSSEGGRAYYGSVDSTPLFVMLLGELRRWGVHEEVVEQLLPYADAALGWIRRSADPFLSYQRNSDQGLINQGWKDSFDAINFADGTLARAPIALAEVQGYVYAAYVVRAYFAHHVGDSALEEEWFTRATRIREEFNERFWLPDRGYYAIGLDGAGRPIDSLASNMGHCLWTGIVDEDKAPSVAERLLSPEMFTGYGVRTLASDMGAYNPMSYHNGSVWPHDNALIAAGLMRYGFAKEAQRIVYGLLDAAEVFGWRLPELFCGFDRAEFAWPVPYPTSSSPQAWAAASPIQLVRTLLRLEPCIPYDRVWLDPVELESLRITGLPLAGSRVTIDVGEEGVAVAGLPEGIALINEPRGPTTPAPSQVC
ncbi:Glycogen debranching enzyme (alpha-1,6-glucosidase) [Streptosporangium subroseum]|uniref:Glycogen debranching enzyme (Alpha-1,6-glucosidase) n=1 Tax=Streptosporangium subroseum TaxID=106412 RepID=A0A239HHG6_9ACTN|nr:glycogen debranching N-terminal domain-containing protein [Streptosporangium subroseum]SNS80273.1 Glycogen debranching enzyme (alpha-1,6-glucosidase) [Streptosporangium subroseum]